MHRANSLNMNNRKSKRDNNDALVPTSNNKLCIYATNKFATRMVTSQIKSSFKLHNLFGDMDLTKWPNPDREATRDATNRDKTHKK